MKYRGVTPELINKIRKHVQLEKVEFKFSCIKTNKSMHYNQYHILLCTILKQCRSPSENSQDFLSLHIQRGNTSRQEVTEYFDQLRQISTREDLDIYKNTVQKYISGPTKINTIFFLLKKETQTRSKTVYPNTMEDRVFFHPNIIANLEEIIA